MKILCTLIIFAFFGLSTNSSHAQCTFIEGDFEEWVDITAALTEDLPAGSIVLPQNTIPFTRLFITFFIDGLLEELLSGNTDPAIISATLLGIERVEDASSGQYALKMFGDTLYNGSDVWIIGDCGAKAEQLKVDIKHLGATEDTIDLFVFIGNSSNLPDLDENGMVVDDNLSSFALGRLVIDEEISEFTTLNLDLTTTQNDISADTAMILVISSFGTPNEGENFSSFIIDNLRFTSGTTSSQDIADLLDIDIYPTITQNEINFESNDIEINSFRIISQDGKIGMHRKVNSYTEKIDISNLPPGNYFLQLQSGMNFQTKRFIKI